MAYEYGTISGHATAPDANADLISRIEAMLTAHAAWSFVKEIVYSSVTYRWWLCSAASNAEGVDFYVALGVDTNNNFSLAISEKFNTSTDKVEDYAPAATLSTMPEADWTVGAAGEQFPSLLSRLPGAVIVSTTSFDYLIKVTENYLLVATSANTSWFGALAGLLESYITTAGRPSCFVAGIGGSLSDRGAVTTRQPNNTTLQYQHTATGVYDATSGWLPSSSRLPSIGGPVDVLSEKYHFGRIAQAVYAPNAARGYLRGLYRDLVVAPVASGHGLVFGDTVTLNGVTYVHVGSYSTVSLWVPNG